MTAVIRTDALTKHYGRVHALDGLDLLCRLRTGGGGADAAVRRRLCADFDLDTRTKGRAYSKGNPDATGNLR